MIEKWSQNKMQRLTRMLKAGKNYYEIALALGTTRNAIAGKVRRLGLSDPKRNPVQRKAVPKKCFPVDEVKARRPKQSAPGSAAALVIKPTRGKPEENRLTPAPHPSTRAPRPSDNIWRPTTCQFPMGNPDDPEFQFCGAKLEPADGRPYCDFHHARCYAKRPEKAPGYGPPEDFKQGSWGGGYR